MTQTPVKKLELHGTLSWCCNKPSLIVLSREGGFVSQNCEACGKPRKITLGELPKLPCHVCHTPMIPYIADKNYAYRCGSCGTEVQLGDLVPHWSERFPRCGLGLESDFRDETHPTHISQPDDLDRVLNEVTRMLSTRK